jgi:hypothetical protein
MEETEKKKRYRERIELMGDPRAIHLNRGYLQIFIGYDAEEMSRFKALGNAIQNLMDYMVEEAIAENRKAEANLYTTTPIAVSEDKSEQEKARD